MRLDDIKEQSDGIGKIVSKYEFSKNRKMTKERTFGHRNESEEECSCDKETCNCNYDF